MGILVESTNYYKCFYCVSTRLKLGKNCKSIVVSALYQIRLPQGRNLHMGSYPHLGNGVMLFALSSHIGILAGMRPCGIILFVTELFISESISQVYGYLHNYCSLYPNTFNNIGM